MLNLWSLYLSLSGVIILFMWMLLDASFCATAEVLLIHLRIEPDLDMGIKGSIAPDGLGLRVVVLAFLVFFISTSYLICCWKSFALHRGTDLKGMLLLVFVACVASFVLSQWKPIAWQGFQLRTSYRAGTTTEDCMLILESWPVRSTLATSLGTLNVPDKNSNVSMLDPLKNSYAFSDQFGPLVYRQKGRVLVDSKTYPRWKLEYSSDGKAPEDLRVDFGRFVIRYTLVKVKEITPTLYLSRYDESMEQIETKGE